MLPVCPLTIVPGHNHSLQRICIMLHTDQRGRGAWLNAWENATIFKVATDSPLKGQYVFREPRIISFIHSFIQQTFVEHAPMTSTVLATGKTKEFTYDRVP